MIDLVFKIIYLIFIISVYVHLYLQWRSNFELKAYLRRLEYDIRELKRHTKYD